MPATKTGPNGQSDKASQPGQDPVLQPFMDFWAKYLEDCNEQVKTVLDGMRSSRDPQAWKRRWLDAVSASADAYMRSPAFLDIMSKNAEMASKTKAQVNRVTEQSARNLGLPHASDIQALIEQLRGMEDRLLERLGKLECRVEAIEGRLAK